MTASALKPDGDLSGACDIGGGNSGGHRQARRRLNKGATIDNRLSPSIIQVVPSAD
ncbi:hypothetical protein [Brevundimonas sp.]|uniref:hypothetical protein n=1 Tax=Brevundimonas sp. TaxID=1871086 RepID=UPI00289EE285|nr:hypothetical protein [Brevundimonas sp.]